MMVAWVTVSNRATPIWIFSLLKVPWHTQTGAYWLQNFLKQEEISAPCIIIFTLKVTEIARDREIEVTGESKSTPVSKARLLFISSSSAASLSSYKQTSIVLAYPILNGMVTSSWLTPSIPSLGISWLSSHSHIDFLLRPWDVCHLAGLGLAPTPITFFEEPSLIWGIISHY